MKLISMTDFVLQQYKEKVPKGFNEHILDALDFEKKCISYAKFLKQPLKLEMFLGESAFFKNIEPCEGGVIEDLILLRTDIELTDFAISKIQL